SPGLGAIRCRLELAQAPKSSIVPTLPSFPNHEARAAIRTPNPDPHKRKMPAKNSHSQVARWGLKEDHGCGIPRAGLHPAALAAKQRRHLQFARRVESPMRMM